MLKSFHEVNVPKSGTSKIQLFGILVCFFIDKTGYSISFILRLILDAYGKKFIVILFVIPEILGELLSHTVNPSEEADAINRNAYVEDWYIYCKRIFQS